MPGLCGRAGFFSNVRLRRFLLVEPDNPPDNFAALTRPRFILIKFVRVWLDDEDEVCSCLMQQRHPVKGNDAKAKVPIAGKRWSIAALASIVGN